MRCIVRRAHVTASAGLSSTPTPALSENSPPTQECNTESDTLDTFLGLPRRTAPREHARPAQRFAASIAAEWAAHFRKLHTVKGGAMLTLCIQAPKGADDSQREALLFRVVGALSFAGADVLCAMERFDGARHPRSLHGHALVRSDQSAAEVHQLALDAGGYRCSCSDVRDLDKCCSYATKNVRAHNIHDLVLRAGNVRLRVGTRVAPRELVPIEKPKRVRRLPAKVTTCACGCGLPLPLAGRSDRAYASATCRKRAQRAREVTQRVTPPSAATNVTGLALEVSGA